MLGWLRALTRSRVERTLLLDPDGFEALLARERSRAERASSCFALLTLDVPAIALQPAELQAIQEIFRQRRRATDLTGWTPDGRIGIALPDTNLAQAKLFATVLHEALVAKGIPPAHAISVYPDPEGHSDHAVQS